MSGRKKRKHEEEENQERWLLTYADMITLLVAFFMMMYSMSVLNLEKFKDAAIGIRSGFNGPIESKKQSGDSVMEKGMSERPKLDIEKVFTPPPKPRANPAQKKTMSKRPMDQPPKTAAEMRQERIGELNKAIMEMLVGVPKGESAKVTSAANGVAIELVGDLIFFPKHSAQLSEEAKRILIAVTSVLSVLPNEVSVEGYTSAFKREENSHFNNSWELSTARAMAVVNYFMESKKLNPARISITGYGDYRPIEKPRNPPQPAEDANDRVRIFVFQE